MASATVAILSVILSFATTERSANAQVAELAGALLEHQREMLKMLKDQIAGIDTTAVVTITNNTGYTLKLMDDFSDSGKVDDWKNAKTIAPQQAGGFAASMKKTEIPILGEMGFAGAVGSVVYNIEGTNSSIMILYSVPYEQTGSAKRSQNHFNVQTFTPVSEGTDLAETLFDQLYDGAYRAGVKTLRLKESQDPARSKAWEMELVRQLKSNPTAAMQTAQKIEALKHNRWLVDADMTDSGNSEINITISDLR